MPNSSQSQNAPEPRTGICTLFEGDYHLGLAALVNSLVRAGYAGNIWAGYRGALPPWLGQLERIDAERHAYRVSADVQLIFVPLETSSHFTHFKPRFMLELLAGPARDRDYLWFFDPDICLRTSWPFFLKWQTCGIALCEEINNYHLSARDPLRCQWMEIGREMGLGEPRPLTGYFNAGMIGISRAYENLFDLWDRIIARAGQMGCDLRGFMPGTREMPFHAIDQDALNMALMYVEHPLSTMGPEGMGLVPGELGVYHTTGPKPWRGSILLRALAGVPPSNAFRFFYTQVASPIRAYSPWRIRARRLECSLAGFLGRFYRKR